MYLAKQIAQYVLEKCEHNGNPIANVQLQQILYCIQCAFLKERNERCFADDFEAFGFGLCAECILPLCRLWRDADYQYSAS